MKNSIQIGLLPNFQTRLCSTLSRQEVLLPLLDQ